MKFLYNELAKKGYSIDKSKSGWSAKYSFESTCKSFEFDDDNTGRMIMLSNLIQAEMAYMKI